MNIEPYLFFDGRCDEAAGFYQEVLGAQVQMRMRFRDSPDPAPPGMVPPGYEDKVMHMTLRIGDSTVHASDGCTPGDAAFKGFALTLAVGDATEAARVFEALAQGGQVQMPLGPTFFSPSFGMLADRYGVPWMVIVPPAETA